MDTQTTRTPEQTARAIFDAINAHDPDAIVACGDPDDYEDEFVALAETIRGRDAIRAYFTEMMAALPDLHMEIERLVAADDVAVVEWRMTGTFSGGPFAGLRPTGRSIDLRGCDVMLISQGLLRRNTVYFDGADFARQVGMLPPRNSKADKAVTAAFNTVTDLRSRIRSARGADRA
jgi:steroid delta-isomerase-like uncharacterized protein